MRDEIAVSDKREFAAGFREGKEGGKFDPEALLVRRIGWLAGRCSKLEDELEAARAETVDRILAAIADVREQGEKKQEEIGATHDKNMRWLQSQVSEAHTEIEELRAELAMKGKGSEVTRMRGSGLH